MNDDTRGRVEDPPAGIPGWSATAVEPAVGGGHRYNRLRRRRIMLLVIVALVIVAAAGALVLTTQIKSPAEQAAQTKPPAQTELTATAQRTVLTTTVLAQGVVGAPAEVSPSIIGSDAGAAGGQNVQQIVTRVFARRGSTVSQGTVLLEVAGQPFFVLQGTVPAYRDLEPGESGEDIVELQEDLESLGYSVGDDSSGVFGAGTAAAVSAFYTGIGYRAPQITSGPKASRGAMIPLGEYSFVPRLPATLVTLGATVGQSVKSSGLTLALGSPVIDGQLSPSDSKLVRPGMQVTITEPGTGITVPGRVTSVSQVTATKASISGGLYVKLGVQADRPLPMSLVGQDVSLTIAAARSSGPVLAVPEAAVFAGANGATYVTRVTGTGLVRVPVRVAMSASGLLQVIPAQPGALTAGDRVLTGENYAGSKPASNPVLRQVGPNSGVKVITPVGGQG
jgi:peptidoglycan hydrolase-like protein with peptidoglycan-binding domain